MRLCRGRQILASGDQRSSRQVQRVINKLRRSFEEAQCVRQAPVIIEGGFVFPAGMDEEKARVAV
jgi:hypothetical protein